MKKDAPVQKESKKGWGLMLLALLFLVVGVASVSAPSPAYAGTHLTAATGIDVIDTENLAQTVRNWIKRNENWIEDLGYLGDIIKGITSVVEVFAELADEFIDQLKKHSILKIFATEAGIKAKVKIEDAKQNAEEALVLTDAITQARAKHAHSGNQQLCRTVLANQATLTTEDFEAAVSCLALSGIEGMYRGQKDDGSGPQYAASEYKLRCALKLGSKVDGYPDSCIDDETTGTDGRKITDSDLSEHIFDGGQVLELPEFKSKKIDTVSYSLPDPQNAEQKFWVAAWYLCYEKAGPRPTPPSKDAIKTPIGMTRRAQWNHCAAMQSSLAKQCTDRLAYYTRPNERFSELREKQEPICQAAERSRIKLDDSYAECKKGLSPYQSLRAVHLLCKGVHFFLANKQAGASDPQASALVDKCTAAWNAWKSMEETGKSASMAGANGQLALQACWPRSGR